MEFSLLENESSLMKISVETRDDRCLNVFTSLIIAGYVIFLTMVCDISSM